MPKITSPTVIRQDTLFYREGTSDKVYKLILRAQPGAAITPPPAAGENYTVEFLYGRRGSNLKGGQKTSRPVSLPAAEAIYNQYLQEKLNKGYRLEGGFSSPLSAGVAERLEEPICPLCRKLIYFPQTLKAHNCQGDINAKIGAEVAAANAKIEELPRMFKCTDCGLTLPMDDWPLTRQGSQGRRLYCRRCGTTSVRETFRDPKLRAALQERREAAKLREAAKRGLENYERGPYSKPKPGSVVDADFPAEEPAPPLAPKRRRFF
jgi:hypothetical protein